MSNISVLIVSGDADWARMLAVHCRRIGLRVRVVPSVREAMEILEAGLPDLMCLDMELPGENGLGLCEMMAADRIASTVPVIVLSERLDPAMIRRCGGLCVYFIRRSADVWHRIKPVIFELVDLGSPGHTSKPSQSLRQQEEF